MGIVLSTQRPEADYVNDHDDVKPEGYVFPNGFVQGQLGFKIRTRSQIARNSDSSTSESEPESEPEPEHQPEDWNDEVGQFVLRLALPNPLSVDSAYETDEELWALRL